MKPKNSSRPSLPRQKGESGGSGRKSTSYYFPSKNKEKIKKSDSTPSTKSTNKAGTPSIKNNQKTQALNFKRLFHQKESTIFLAIKESQGEKQYPRTLYGSIKRLWPQLSELNAQGFGIFMLPNKAVGKVRKNSDISKVNAFFIDYDGDDWKGLKKEEILAKFHLPPHCVVETSPGHYHVYWLVVNVNLEDYSPVQKRLALEYESDPNISDLSRVMRLPGLLNNKPKHNRFLATIIHIESTKKGYDFDSFMKHLPSSSVKVTRSEPEDIPLKGRPGESGHTRSEVEGWLTRINPDDRHKWTTVGMGLKTEFGETGWSMFEEWSSQSSKYEHKEARRQWNSFNRNHANGVTVNTIRYLANESHSSGGSYSDPFDLAIDFTKITLERLKYNPYNQSWHAYTNGIWSSTKAHVEFKALEYIKHAIPKSNSSLGRLRSSAGINELLNIAKNNSACHIESNHFDSQPNTIGVKLSSGEIACIDLDTGKLLKPSPLNNLTKHTQAIFVKNQDCPLFKEFTSQIMDSDSEMVDCLQSILGYTLFGHTKEQLIFFFVGSGANGKGVLMNIIRHVIGEYATVISGTLLRKHTQNPNASTPALKDLVGRRLIMCTELQKDSRLDEEFIKIITGSDQISYRGNYADQSKFTPQGKIIICTNNFPQIAFDDKAMWRRIFAIKFPVSFTGKERNNDLEDQLKSEASGILNWLIEGAYLYAKGGKIPRPKAAKEYLSHLKQSSDTVGNWLNDCCQKDDGARAAAGKSYDSYKEHARNNKRPPLSSKEFKSELEKKGFGSIKRNNGNFFDGFSLKPSVVSDGIKRL